MHQLSDDCVAAARMVPSGAIYDECRQEFLLMAARIATQAAMVESKAGGRGWSGPPAPSAPEAVRLFDACLRFASGDSSGEIREGRAYALAYDGRIQEAIQQAAEVYPQRHATPSYAYNLACLNSISGNTDLAFQWLEYAIKGCGWNSIPQAKKDPDLATVRAAKREAFAQLTTPTCNWEIKFGLLMDDVVITNTSPFAITNVVLDVRVESKDHVWTPQLKVDRIEPGDTHTWVDVFSIPGNRVGRKSARFECDQDR
jgi:hypothetical protein